MFFAIHAIGTARIARANPTLLPERAKLPLHRGQPLADKVVLASIMATYAAELILISVDVAQWGWGPPIPPSVAGLGLGLFVAGWALAMRALETNAFATTVVRHQPDRGHTVVETGVYRVVRHPMYAGLVGVLLGVPLWMGSLLGLIAAVCPISLLILRISLEESVLRASLPGYDAYARRVSARLVPGVW